MILSRYATNSEGTQRASNADEVEALLRDRLRTTNIAGPDLIVAGTDNFLSPAHRLPNGEEKPTLHFIPELTEGYQVLQKPGVAFGAALAQLAGAIDWARLGRMPWPRIANDARFPESEGGEFGGPPTS
jgi:hypothetical protein